MASLTDFSPAFLAGDPAATAFLADGFRRPADRAAAVRLAAARRADPALVAALARQATDGAEAPAPTAAQRRALDALANGGAAAVVTGQQVGLHLGPLYTLHKAAAAIATARALEAETGTPCVPVFWLATEDHDLDEVRRVAVATAEGPTWLEVPADGRDRVPLRYRTLPPEVAAVHAALRESLERLPGAAAVLAWAERHWRPGRPWAAAFAGALTALLGAEGLLLLDPRDPAVAAVAAPVLRAALDEADALAEALADRVAALRGAGFEEQVHVRAGAPLVFFHPDGPEGPRYRLEPAGPAQWALVGADRRVSRDAVRAAAERDPLALSTSALLRAAVQDALLPTALFLGGPAELGYLAQLAPVYAALGVPQPLAAPRASFRLVDAKARTLLRELALAPADTDQPRAALLARRALARDAALPAPAALRADLRAEAEALVAGAAARLSPLGPVLAPALDRTRGTLTHALERFADHYERALAQQDAVATARLDRLLALLRPDGAPQERVYGLAGWAARYGLDALVARLLGACRPFAAGTVDVALDEG